MLSETEQREIETEAAAYPLRRSACIDALIIVQRHRGWISDESIRDVAAVLGMTSHEVDAVATFYNGDIDPDTPERRGLQKYFPVADPANA